MAQPTADHGEHHFFEPVVYPFRSNDWLGSMWWMPFLNYVPIMNLILFRGWRLEVVRRMARDDSQPLPPFDLGKFFMNGCLLWLMTGLYSLVPILIITQLGVGGFGDLIGDLRYLFDYFFTDKKVMPLDEFLVGEFWENIATIAIDAMWLVASFPLYRVAMLHYAITGRVWSFFSIFKNVKLVASYLKHFFDFYVFSLTIGFLVSVVSGVLLATFVGVIVIPLAVPAVYYWSTAIEFGFLARKIVVDSRAAIK